MKNKNGFVFIAILGIGAYAYMRNINAEASGGAPPPAATGVPLVKVDTIIVNLADEDELHYLKLALELQVGESGDVEKCTQNMAKIRNEIILFASALSVADTRGEKLKSELLHRLTGRLNKAFGGEMVKAAYLTDFVVQ